MLRVLREGRGAGGKRGLLLMSAVEALPAAMVSAEAIGALSALAHDGRLEIFRLLVRAGPPGLPAGEIARTTGAPASTLSTNLSILAGAGLVSSRREGRSIIYAAAYSRMSDLIGFLMEDCCGGNAEICAPVAEVANRCCAPVCC